MAHQASFHAAGSTKTERALLAGNRCGKSVCGGYEVAVHATGLYPSWWTGRRFEGPTDWWIAGATIEACRDVPQQILFGKDLDEHLGTGLVPKACIGKVTRKQIPDAMDRILVKHVTGRWSRIAAKSYDMEARKWRGSLLHGIWYDEEPPEAIYSEGSARLTDRNGIAMLTLTPLDGMTKVVSYFYPEPTSPERFLVRAEQETCGLYSKTFVQKRLRSYPQHEREARSKGIPLLGSGPVFPVAESTFVINAGDIEIPRTWPVVIGMDFGWDHPTAAIRAAYDRQTDTIYLTREYRQNESLITVHAAAVKALGGDKVPVVWPHDGWAMAGGAGKSDKSTAELYRAAGLRMWSTHATFPDGGYGTEAIIQAMLDRMRTGKLKVLSTCPQWIEEYRTYHRKDGKLVKDRDDLLSASMKAVMMIRVARTEEAPPVRKPSSGQGGWDPFAGLAQKAFT